MIQLANQDSNIEPRSSGAYSVVRLMPNDPSHRKLFPQIVNRAVGFVDRINADSDPIWVGHLLYNHFQQRNNLVHVMAGIDAESKIVLHAISYVETRPKLGNVIILYQLEKDEAGGSDMLNVCFDLVKSWAVSLGIKTLLNESSNRAKTRLWGRYGFSEYRVTSRLDLE